MIAIDAIKLLTANGMSESCQTCQREHRDCYYSQKYTLSDFCEWVENAMEESVEIVQCKDCEFWRKEKEIISGFRACAVWSTSDTTRYTANTDFCSKAERKEKDGEAHKEWDALMAQYAGEAETVAMEMSSE